MATPFEEFRQAMFASLAKIAKNRDEVLGFEVLNEPELNRYVIMFGNRVCMTNPSQWANAREQGDERKAAFVDRQLRKVRGKGLVNPYANPNIFRVDHVLEFINRTLVDILSVLPDKGASLKLGAQETLEALSAGETVSRCSKYRQLNNVLIDAIKSRLTKKEKTDGK